MSLGERVKRLLDVITEKLPDLFPMGELEERTSDERSPYVGVFLQECERMNMLLFELKRSLGELDMGLKGDLSITEAMEALMNALYDDRVPASWAAKAYPSLRALGPWLYNLLERQRQLVEDLKVQNAQLVTTYKAKVEADTRYAAAKRARIEAGVGS